MLSKIKSELKNLWGSKKSRGDLDDKIIGHIMERAEKSLTNWTFGSSDINTLFNKNWTFATNMQV